MVTDALQDQGLGESAPQWLLWYLNGSDIYAQLDATPNINKDLLIGSMQTRELAEEVVGSHNQILKHVQRSEFGCGPS